MREEVVQVLPVVNVIVYEENRFLLIQEAKESCQGLWHLPAGGILKGESLPQAAIREVVEESGIIIEPIGLFEVHRNVQDPHELWRFIVVGKSAGGKLKKKADKESLQADWFFIEELSDLSLRNQMILGLLKRYQTNPLIIPINAYHHHTSGY